MSDVERGRNEPKADTINRFCEALGIPYEDVETLRNANVVLTHPLDEAPLLHLDIRPVPGFTGREDMLDSIDKALWQKGGTAALTNNVKSAAVKGLGGVGKSVLAREYAWRARERYRGIWWVRAETEQTLIDDLINLASRLIPNLAEVAERDLALHRALDAIAGTGADKPWLIIYDNVEKPGAIARLTPKTGAHILITSRWPRWRSHAQELPVDVFPEDTAVNFLLAERPQESGETAGRLAAALGYLPLALSHARAYCAETNLSFDDYTRRLAELIQESPEDAEYPASVFATFSLAIAKVAEACPEAEKLMEIAAFLAPDRIPLDIITDDVMSEKRKEKAVAALFRISLISHETLDHGGNAISVHRLVQEVMRQKLNEHISGNTAQVLRLIVNAIGDPRLALYYYKWEYLRTITPHAIEILKYNHKNSDAGLVAFIIGRFFSLQGAYSQAEPICKLGIEIRQKILGSEHIDYAMSIFSLAELHVYNRRYDEAEPLLKQVLYIHENALGKYDPRVGICLKNLAIACVELEKHHESLSLCTRAIHILENTVSGDLPEPERINYNFNLAQSYSTLADVYHATEYNLEAETQYKRAIALVERAVGAVHPESGLILAKLAEVYISQEQYGEAASTYERSLIVSEKALGPDHPATKVFRSKFEHLSRTMAGKTDGEREDVRGKWSFRLLGSY